MATKEIAIFGGGCFWCTEAIFEELKGVISVASGYAGGAIEKPSYEDVSTGSTGHAESIKIEFDPEQISYKDLLTVFFATHDPTTPDRQGADVGSQYRSIILYTTDQQKTEAEELIKNLNESTEEGAPIVTEVKSLDKFHEAEDYHQDFYKNNPSQNYCQVVINPKLQKLREKFSQLLKKSASN